jgi:primosomal protein N'
MVKLRDEYRYQIQLQAPDGELLRTIVRHATTSLKSPDGVFWTADVDPLDMM